MKAASPCVAIAAMLLLAAGCGGNARSAGGKGSAADAISVVGNTDACASQMHDLCGAFLDYLRTHPTLPPTLDALDKSFLPTGAQAFFCPVARQAYVYRPNGILLPEKNARIILYDAVPAHRGFRMAIRAEEPDGGLAPIMKVVALPESFFLLRPPGSDTAVPQRP